MRRLALMVLVLTLGGCADRLAERQAQLARLVGHSEADLLQAMGVPNRTYETGGDKFLAYTESRIVFVPSYPAGPPPWGYYAGAFPPQPLNLTCETTFMIAGGVVTSLTVRGNGCS